MPPSLALFLWLVLLLALLCFDPAKERGISPALWVPLTWMFILASRLPSQWLGWTALTSAAEAFEEGNPLDRAIFSLLILLAVGILMSRSFQWDSFLARNMALMAFLSFALLSVFWSDFPLVSFKRWGRDLGNYLTVLVVLSDPRPLEAIRTLLRRLCYLSIPLSILLIKYFPHSGRRYSEWTGTVTYTGLTTTKDMLAVVCLVSGIFFFWDTVTRWSDRKERRTKPTIAVNVAFVAMTLWLLNLADSATCRVCLALGCLVIAAAHLRAVRRHPAPLKLLIPLSVCLCLFLVFGMDIKASIAKAVGRDPTFTDRTLFWPYLLSMNTDRFLGTGYESFWLGSRLDQIWTTWNFKPNQAHNGYLEVYLNLGLIGLFLLGGFLIASYGTICKRFTPPSSFASLGLALWAMLSIYNITTSCFGKGELMWVTFLLAAIAVPERARDRVPSLAAFDKAGATERFPRVPLRTTGLRGSECAAHRAPFDPGPGGRPGKRSRP